MRLWWLWIGLSQWAFVATAKPDSLPDSSVANVLKTIPDCAIDCFASALKGSSCTETNATCICEDAPLLQQASLCVQANCTIPETLFVKNATEATLCHQPPRDKSRLIYNTAAAFGIITGVFVVSRLGIRYYLGLRLGADDWFTLATTIVGASSTAVVCVLLTHNGLGRDIWTLTPEQIRHFGINFYSQQSLYFVIVSMEKTIFLLFYLQVFPRTNIRHILWATIVFNCLVGFAYAMASVFSCTPISYFWQKWDGLHQGKCININMMTWTNAGLTIALDFWTIGIPIWEIRGLNLSPRKKLGAIVMFSLGALVTIVSILRLRTVVQFGADSPNPTWEFVYIMLWSNLELNIGIICACLPAFRLLLVHLIQWMGDSLPSRNRSSLRYADQTTVRTKKTGTGERGGSAFALTEISFSHRKPKGGRQGADLTDEEGLVQKGIVVTRDVDVRSSNSLD